MDIEAAEQRPPSSVDTPTLDEPAFAPVKGGRRGSDSPASRRRSSVGEMLRGSEIGERASIMADRVSYAVAQAAVEFVETPVRRPARNTVVFKDDPENQRQPL